MPLWNVSFVPSTYHRAWLQQVLNDFCQDKGQNIQTPYSSLPF